MSADEQPTASVSTADKSLHGCRRMLGVDRVLLLNPKHWIYPAPLRTSESMYSFFESTLWLFDSINSLCEFWYALYSESWYTTYSSEPTCSQCFSGRPGPSTVRHSIQQLSLTGSSWHHHHQFIRSTISHHFRGTWKHPRSLSDHRPRQQSFFITSIWFERSLCRPQGNLFHRSNGHWLLWSSPAWYWYGRPFPYQTVFMSSTSLCTPGRGRHLRWDAGIRGHRTFR